MLGHSRLGGHYMRSAIAGIGAALGRLSGIRESVRFRIIKVSLTLGIARSQ